MGWQNEHSGPHTSVLRLSKEIVTYNTVHSAWPFNRRKIIPGYNVVEKYFTRGWWAGCGWGDELNPEPTSSGFVKQTWCDNTAA